MPPNAGRIYWERALFNKIKRTIIRFQSLEELMLSEDGKKVSFQKDLFWEIELFCDNIFFPPIFLVFSQDKTFHV